MHDGRPVPSFEGALRQALLARVPALPASAVGESAFTQVARTCDAADFDFRATIEATLSPAVAREVLAATSAFRLQVRAVRAEASAEASHVAVAGAGGGLPDPLDVVTPRLENLSHVAAVRLADVSDRARARVAALRERANARIDPVLTIAAREALIVAKRARLVAFRGAVHAALIPFTARMNRYSDTVESLAMVADGWY